MKPNVVDTHLNQPPQPALADQIVDVCLAHTGGDSQNQPVTPAVLKASQRLAENAQTPPPLVADDLRAFDTDERRDVADPPQVPSDLIGDQLAVGENLEVAIGVRGEDFQQLWMQERLASQNAEVAVAMPLGIIQDAVHVLERDAFSRRVNVN